ncbi:MAG: hypothetical protein ACTSRC_08950 [Candidatus Helarchaeota archaeon]
MSILGFLGDLVNRPEVAIDSMNAQRNKLKTLLLIIGTGMLFLSNYFISHFLGAYPEALIFILILAVFGILVVFLFVLGFVIDSYIYFKLIRYTPAGETAKALSWCVLIPMLIFHAGLFCLNIFLISIGRIEWIGYLYDQLKWLMYIWIFGLIAVVVMRNQAEHKIRNLLAIMGTFSLNFIIWVTLDWLLMQALYTTFI